MLKNLTKDLENVAYSERFAGIGSKRPGGFANLVSNDAKYIFVGFNRTKRWRLRNNSYNATYSLFNVQQQKYESSFFDTPDFQNICESGPSKIQYISWSPKGHQGVFICDFNVFFFEDPRDLSKVTKITYDGLDNSLSFSN